MKGALHREKQNFSVALLRWNKENSLFIYLFILKIYSAMQVTLFWVCDNGAFNLKVHFAVCETKILKVLLAEKSNFS